MFYLDIQKFKKAMNTLEFKQGIGGTATCMKIIIKAAKECGKMS